MTEFQKLIDAVKASNKSKIESLHDRDNDLIHTKLDKLGNTAFTLACEDADLETVKLLINLGADINHADDHGRNGLMAAIENRRKHIIRYLFENDQLIHDEATESQGGEGYYHTAFTFACQFADLQIVKLLEKLGADIRQSSEGKNGLMCAASAGKTYIIDYLHSQNDQLIHGKDEDGHTAVTLACRDANLETVQCLVKLGADLNLGSQNDQNGLLLAAEKGKPDIIDFLHSKNNKLILAKDKHGHNAATLACRWHGDLETIKKLEELDSDNIIINEPGMNNRTALGYAAEKNKRDIIEYLIMRHHKMVHHLDKLNHSVFTIPEKFETIEFILERYLAAKQTLATDKTSILSYQSQKSSSQLTG